MTEPAQPAAIGQRPAPAAAAAPLSDLLLGPKRDAEILGRSSDVVWLGVSEQVVVVADAPGAGLPNAVIAPRGKLPSNGPVAVGGGGITSPRTQVRVRRWWRSRPTLPRTRPALVWETLQQCPRTMPAVGDAGIGRALACRSDAGLLRSADELLGAGGGLTPEGDDVIIGALAAHRLVGDAIGAPSLRLDDALGGLLLERSQERTTRLSASLIGHALRAEVAAPLGTLLRALTGRGATLPAFRALLRVGHSSGRAMAHGALCGARAAVEAAA